VRRQVPDPEVAGLQVLSHAGRLLRLLLLLQGLSAAHSDEELL